MKYRDVYLDRLASGMMALDESERRVLEDIYSNIQKGDYHISREEYDKMFKDYQKKVAITNLLLSEKLLLNKIKKEEYGEYPVLGISINRLKYDPEINGYNFNFNYLSGSYSNMPGEMNTKSISSEVLKSGEEFKEFYDNREYQKLKEQKERLLQDYIFNTAMSTAVVLTSIYGSPLAGAALSASTNLLGGSTDVVTEINASKGITDPKVRLISEGLTSLVFDTGKYIADKMEIEGKIEADNIKYINERFGFGGKFGIKGEKIEYLTFEGINNPEMRYHLKKWDSKEGMGSWSNGRLITIGEEKVAWDKDTIDKLIKEKAKKEREDIRAGHSHTKDKELAAVDKEERLAKKLVEGEIDLTKDKGIGDFREGAKAYEDFTGDNAVERFLDYVEKQ
ncbi:hypothetical protein [Miniphocaeibacter massiliensis]|uniref:hypothetical protein n=1 Tax=Miniphocaeibacter massiliensis TaxID=2041841 RepID=UPI000C1B99E5|nr:hypothetical protein [Miniphocaeibacter massiliensis]